MRKKKGYTYALLQVPSGANGSGSAEGKAGEHHGDEKLPVFFCFFCRLVSVTLG